MTRPDASAEQDTRPGALLGPYVPSSVLRWPEGTAWQTVDGTLVSADISGFTALAERLAGLGREGSEELTRILNGRLTAMITWVHDRGGDVLKFGGDALLCLFEGDGHADRAVEASIGMRATLREPVRSDFAGSIQLSVSIGMHTGTLHLFLADDGAHRELLVAGPGASATITAESAASAGQILARRCTVERLTTRHEVDELDDGWIALDGDPVHDATPVDPRDISLAVPTRLMAPSHRERLEQVGPGIGEHRRATITFIEFSGVDTLLASDGPAHVHATFEAMLRALGAACDEHDVQLIGTDVTVDGGKIILATGAMGPTDDAATRSLLVASMAMDAAPQLHLRAGVNGGPIFVGDLGGPTRRALTVMGDAVNLAARLMGQATDRQVVAAAGTVTASSLELEHDPLEPFRVKGKSVPVRASVVHAVTSRTISRSTDAGSADGRADQLDALLAAWRTVQAGDGVGILLLGTAGMGKSQLLSRFGELAEAPLHRAIAHPRRSGRPFAATSQLWRSALGLPQEPVAAAAAVRALCERVDPSQVPLLPLLAGPLELPIATTRESDDVRAEFLRERSALLLLRLLDATLVGPTVLVAEDCHVADRASIELFAYVQARSADRPWLLLATSEASLAPLEDLDVVTLGPLADEVVRRIVLEHASSALTDRDVAAIVLRAQGNPLYAAELAAVTGAGHGLPTTIDDAMRRRLDALGPGERLALSEAAVIGNEGPLDLARAVSEAFRELVWSRVTELVDRSPVAFRFQHRLIRDAAYDALAYARRRAVHGLVAEALEHQHASADELSLHYHEARRPEAWKWSILAAEYAEVQHSMADAATLYARAVSASGRTPDLDPAEVGRVCELYGDACEIAGDFLAAREAYDLARSYFENELVSDTRIMRKIGILEERQARYDTSVEMYEGVLARLEAEAGAAAIVLGVQAQLGLAAARFRQSDYPAARHHATAAASGARHAGDSHALAHAYLLLDNALTYDGEASNYAERAAALFRRVGDRLYEAHALNNMGVAAYFHGRWDAAIVHYRDAEARYHEVGDVRSAALAANNIGEVYSDQGRHDDALAPFADAIRGFEATGYEMGRLVARGNRARLLHRTGHAAAAESVFVSVAEGFAGIGARYYEQTTKLRLAEVLADLARPTEALALVEAIDGAGGDPTMMVGAGRLRALLRPALQEPAASVDDELTLVITTAQDADATYDLALTLALRSHTRGGDPDDRGRAALLLETLGAAPDTRPPGWSLLL
jgi:class 3 adenylate cyclase/tetratricopeptide (TPR) repeat protein